MLTDRPESFIISEFIREAILNLAQEEVPHSTAVVMEEMKERPNGMVISGSAFWWRKIRKKIMIGREGRLLKRIGQVSGSRSRHFGETGLSGPLVKTRKDWRNSLPALQELGYVEREQ